jgi:hypothetical protein
MNTRLWHQSKEGWGLLPPTGYPDEQTLHNLIESTPGILPLSGQPRLTIIGKEVNLAGNKADLIAIDEHGGIVVIEVKLKTNPEARRAVIAQVLTYAAALNAMSVVDLENRCSGYLATKGFGSILAAMEDALQGGHQSDQATLSTQMAESLKSGAFRLVIVLDQAPPELITLVGYLDTVANELTLDLITIAAYTVGDEQVIVPQRVEPSKMDHGHNETPTPKPKPQTHTTEYVPGSSTFRASIETATPENRPQLEVLTSWAERLEAEGLAQLMTTIGKSRWTLRVQLPGTDTCIALVWNQNGGSLSMYRSVIEKYAPNCLEAIANASLPVQLESPTSVKLPSPALLDTLTQAYREAAGPPTT